MHARVHTCMCVCDINHRALHIPGKQSHPQSPGKHSVVRARGQNLRLCWPHHTTPEAPAHRCHYSTTQPHTIYKQGWLWGFCFLIIYKSDSSSAMAEDSHLLGWALDLPQACDRRFQLKDEVVRGSEAM